MKRKQPARNASPTPSKASSTKSTRAKAAMDGFFARKNASEASTAPPTESKAPSLATSWPQVPPFPASWDPSEAGDDGASSQTLKLPSAAESPTVAGDQDLIPAAQPSPPTAFDRDSLFAAVNGGTAQQAFTQMAGAPLTEENLETLQENLKSALQGELEAQGTTQDGGLEWVPRIDLTAHERARYQALKNVLETGQWDSRSSLANRMRATYPNIKMKSLTPDEAKEWQNKFCTDEMQELTVVKTQETSWRRVDTTLARYRPFGKVVQDLGGWGDALAVAGATKGCSKCLILGPPWWRIHPQTEMLEFIILEGGWEEKFSRCWTECKSHMMADAGSQPPIAGPSKQLAPPPSSSGEPPSASLGQETLEAHALMHKTH